MHVVLLRTEPSGENSLVASHFLDWRVLLLKTQVCVIPSLLPW